MGDLVCLAITVLWTMHYYRKNPYEEGDSRTARVIGIILTLIFRFILIEFIWGIIAVLLLKNVYGTFFSMFLQTRR